MIGSRCCRGELELNLCPKKDLLTQRIGILDARCCLCDETLEACASLFFTCPMATALGFSYSWCLKSCRVRVFSNKDILKLALDPFIQAALTTHHSESLAYQRSLLMVITSETLWTLRNQISHKGEQINLVSTINNLEYRVKEFLLGVECSEKQVPHDVVH